MFEGQISIGSQRQGPAKAFHACEAASGDRVDRVFPVAKDHTAHLGTMHDAIFRH